MTKSEELGLTLRDCDNAAEEYLTTGVTRIPAVHVDEPDDMQRAAFIDGVLARLRAEKRGSMPPKANGGGRSEMI